MLNIGYHQSISAGWDKLVDTALKANANTFAFFTRNPRSSFKDAPLAISIETQKKLALLQSKLITNNFAPLVAHAPYTANPCSEDETKREGAWSLIKSDIAFMRDFLPHNFYNFHPGSPKSLGTDEGILQTASMVAKITQDLNLFSTSTLPSVTILIETMAGKGSEIGNTFEQIACILNTTERLTSHSCTSFVGVCLDTCHIWDAGYDIVNDLEKTLLAFDNIIGISRIKAIHLNDSKNPCGSKKDRHEITGNGFIGFQTLYNIAHHPLLKDLPFILETPNDEVGYATEIARLKSPL